MAATRLQWLWYNIWDISTCHRLWLLLSVSHNITERIQEFIKRESHGGIFIRFQQYKWGNNRSKSILKKDFSVRLRLKRFQVNREDYYHLCWNSLFDVVRHPEWQSESVSGPKKELLLKGTERKFQLGFFTSTGRSGFIDKTKTLDNVVLVMYRLSWLQQLGRKKSKTKEWKMFYLSSLLLH